MDFELLIALSVLWISSTVAMVSSLVMWFDNDAESFHPHSVAIDHRHKHFLVVSARTECKTDCAVKSISEFAAPRGSSSSKYMTTICIMIAVAGFLGTSRWYAVGDAKAVEALLSFTGFTCLLPVALFELDVEPERYLEQKLLVTGWLISKLGLEKHCDFPLDPGDQKFLDFIRRSKGIHSLYSEDRYLKYQHPEHRQWRYHPVWNSLHMLGALGFEIFVTAAILINDAAEEKVAWITGVSFLSFGLLGYLTGGYLPVIKPLQCWAITWNPFVAEPNFMYKLIEAIRDDNARAKGQLPRSDSYSSDSSLNSSITKISKRNNKNMIAETPPPPTILPEVLGPEDADKFLDILPLKLARRYPKAYLRSLGHLLVMVELFALMTPCVAMGIQWITAQCHRPPVMVLLEVFGLILRCVLFKQCAALETHCILE